MEGRNTLKTYMKSLQEIPCFYELLPYESYDEETQLFFNRDATGFVLLSSPLVGASLDNQQSIANFFRQKDNLPSGASMQFLLFASPCVGPKLAQWQEAHQGEVFQKMAADRVKFLASKAFDDGTGLVIRDYRILISYTVPGHVEGFQKQQLMMLRENLQSTLREMAMATQVVDACALIREVGNILNLQETVWPHQSDWDEYDSLAKSMVDAGRNFLETENEVLMNDGTTICRSYAPKFSPKYWSLSQMDGFIGHIVERHSSLACPFLLHFGIFAEAEQGKRAAKAKAKRETEIKMMQNGLARFDADLPDRLQESHELIEELDRGERIVVSNLSYTLFSTTDLIHKHERHLESICQRNGWQFEPTRYSHLAMLLSSLPMTWTLGQTIRPFKKTYGMGSDLEKMRRAKLTITKQAQNNLPILGEWKGQSAPGIPLVGRRGQLFFWNQFGDMILPRGQNSAATTMGAEESYNVAISGYTGSGKSVFINEMAKMILGFGGRVFIMDHGRSFEKMCKNYQGQHIDFAVNSKICINQFSTMPLGGTPEDQAERRTILEAVNSIFKVMVSPNNPTTPLEDTILQECIDQSWEKFGRNSCVDTVQELLLSRPELEAKNLGQCLYRFSSKGAYGHFFNGPSTVDLRDRFVVIETENLKNFPQLLAVTLQMLIVQINNIMARGDRKSPFAVIVDEARNTIFTGPSFAEFFARAGRTTRKHKGSIVLATQLLTDYFDPNCPQASEVFKNSAWKCILMPKAEEVGEMKTHPALKEFVNSDYRESIIRSLHANPPFYSEVALFSGNTGGVVGRLRLDGFSRLLYSTNPDEWGAIQELLDAGMAVEEAVETVRKRQEAMRHGV